jgi:hypothetical protein
MLEEWGQGEVAQTVYTHVSKYKKDKLKGEKHSKIPPKNL